jgi:large conductance mechanosensitive channel
VETEEGSVLDLAVGVVIGVAFDKIVASLVENVIMPVAGVFTGEVEFSTHALAIGMIAKGEPSTTRLFSRSSTS